MLPEIMKHNYTFFFGGAEVSKNLRRNGAAWAHRCLKGLIIAKNGPKMIKNGWFWPSRLDSSSSTVTTSLLVLQNIRYYHTEHYLQTWSAHRQSQFNL